MSNHESETIAEISKISTETATGNTVVCTPQDAFALEHTFDSDLVYNIDINFSCYDCDENLRFYGARIVFEAQTLLH